MEYQYYWLVGYPEDGGEVWEYMTFRDINAAKRKAGSIAKKINGPVDLADGNVAGDWSDRYITTASPSEFHAVGYRLERLDT